VIYEVWRETWDAYMKVMWTLESRKRPHGKKRNTWENNIERGLECI
jgi:hypothetical protein